MNSPEPTPNHTEQNSAQEEGTPTATTEATPETTSAATTPVSEAGLNKLRPRTGPIVWGALVLAFCIYIAQRSFAPATVDTTAWLISGVIGLGVLLLIVGLVVLVRGSRRE